MLDPSQLLPAVLQARLAAASSPDAFNGMATASNPFTRPSLVAQGAPPADVADVASGTLPQPAPTQTEKAQAELGRVENTGSGVSQIHNPFLHALAAVGDTIGTLALPRVAQAIAGTTLHHQQVVARDESIVRNDQAQDQASAQLADTKGQTAERAALADKASSLSDADAPITMTQEQANAINQPGLAGTQTTLRDYSHAVTAVGNNNTSDTNNQRNNSTKQSVSDDKIAGAQSISDDKIAAAAEAAKNKPMQRDDHAIAIKQQAYEAQGLAPEAAYAKAYGDWVVQTKTQPGVARAAAYASFRPVQVIDPASNNVVYTSAGNAEKSGAATPASADFAAEKAVQKYMTSGPGGATLTAGNTLTHHLGLYDVAVDAVQNGDMPLMNAIGNQLGIQMGDDAQTNLNLIRQGVAMEAARYWTGGVPGDAEIQQFNKSLSGDGSPAQMHGGASTVRAMAAGKTKSLEEQAAAGRQGKANFGGGTSAPGAGGGGIPAAAAAALQEGVEHTFGNGQVWTKQGGKPVRVR
jgi:hypothetical protein